MSQMVMSTWMPYLPDCKHSRVLWLGSAPMPVAHLQCQVPIIHGSTHNSHYSHRSLCVIPVCWFLNLFACLRVIPRNSSKLFPVDCLAPLKRRKSTSTQVSWIAISSPTRQSWLTSYPWPRGENSWRFFMWGYTSVSGGIAGAVWWSTVSQLCQRWAVLKYLLWPLTTEKLSPLCV